MFRDRGVEPVAVHEVQEIQTALGLVASGMGLCVVPTGVQRLRPDEVVYRPFVDPGMVSPIIMSTRLHDQSEDLLLLRRLIDDIYRMQAEERRQQEERAQLRAAGIIGDPAALI